MKDITKININKLSVSTFYDDKTRSSFCWQYFGSLVYCDGIKRKVLNPDRVYCSACLDAVKEETNDVTFGAVKVKRYNKTVSTGNLTRHLRDDHRIEDYRPTDEEVRHRITELRAKTVKSSKSAKHTKCLLARDLALWFCKSLLPFDSVSDVGMTDFLMKYEILVTKNHLPSDRDVSFTALNELYKGMLVKIKEQISEDADQHLAMTFDLWSDRHRQLDYITFTLHYLTSEFELKTLNLSTQIVTGTKTGEAIKDVINEVKSQFGLEGKTIHAVTNADASVTGAVTLANMDQHFCLGQGLHNLIMVDGIHTVPEILSLVKKCENIVKTLRFKLPELEDEDEDAEEQELFHSLEKAAQLIECDENEPLNQNDLTIETKFEYSTLEEGNTTPVVTPTRWHVILEMLETVVLTTGNHKVMTQNESILSQREWILLGELITFLKRFREVVEILSLKNTCTMNVALVFRSEIKDILKTVSDDTSSVILRLKSNMLGNIDKRFPITKVMVAAALLDTRFMALSEVDSYLEAHEMSKCSFLASYHKEVIKTDEKIPPIVFDDTSVPKSNDTPSILKKLSLKHSVGGCQMLDDPVEQECLCYLASADPTAPKDGNLLTFWNEMKISLPRLAALARSVLCVPAISTSSERMFTSTGLLHSAKRSRLPPSKINKIMFVHDNITHY